MIPFVITLRIIISATLVCLTAAASAETAEHRILFVGNSLTAANGLPDMVCRLAAAAGRKATCESIAPGGYSLEDHLAAGNVLERLREGRWSVVVLQQGPSALEESRRALRAAVRQLGPAIREAGARPALYAPWPWKSRGADFARVAESYRLAARDVDGLLFPAGSAWQTAWRRDKAIPLYGRDDFHPSVAGSYLAALVIYAGIYGDLSALFGKRDVAERVTGRSIEVDRGQLASILAAARDVSGLR